MIMLRLLRALRVPVMLALLVLPLSGNAAMGVKDACVDLTNALVNNLAMSSSRSFSLDLDNKDGGYSVLSLWVQLTDADSSITRFDITCTVSNDGNTTDYTPQVCDDTSDGICTLTDSGVWQKASPGTKNFPVTLGIAGKPDAECTFSVGTGAATAILDVLTVKGRLCTK